MERPINFYPQPALTVKPRLEVLGPLPDGCIATKIWIEESIPGFLLCMTDQYRDFMIDIETGEVTEVTRGTE